jgi:hypothetical protein
MSPPQGKAMTATIIKMDNAGYPAGDIPASVSMRRRISSFNRTASGLSAREQSAGGGKACKRVGAY